MIVTIRRVRCRKINFILRSPRILYRYDILNILHNIFRHFLALLHWSCLISIDMDSLGSKVNVCSSFLPFMSGLGASALDKVDGLAVA